MQTVPCNVDPSFYSSEKMQYITWACYRNGFIIITEIQTSLLTIHENYMGRPGKEHLLNGYDWKKNMQEE